MGSHLLNLPIPVNTDFLWQLYERLPTPAAKSLSYGIPYLLPFYHLFLPVVTLRGQTPPQGKPGTVVVAGNERWASYLSDRFFSHPPAREPAGKVPLWRLPQALARQHDSADLIIVRVDRLAARLFFGSGYLAVPEWVEMRMPVPDDPDQLLRASSSVKDDVRVMRRHGLTPEMSHETADFEHFYHHMYIPFICNRYGEQAIVRNIYQIRRFFAHQGCLLWIRGQDERVAGALLQRVGTTLNFVAVGTANGDWAPVKAGAMAALYYHAAEYARDVGCQQIDFGGCRPLLNDGVLRYKRKWSMNLADRRVSFFDFLVWWRHLDERILAFLSETPLIFRDRGELSALTIIDKKMPPKPAQVRKVHRSQWTPGLRQLYIAAPANGPLGDDLPPQTSLVDLAMVAGWPQHITWRG